MRRSNSKFKPFEKELQKLENNLWKISKKSANTGDLFWIPIICPSCLSVLTSSIGTTKLECLQCKKTFKLEVVS